LPDPMRLEDYKHQLEKQHPVYEIATFEGLVVRTQSGFYTVETPAGHITCQIAGTLKEIKEDSHQTRDLVALGDRVRLERQVDGRGIITHVSPRQYVLSRTDPRSAVGTSAENEQIIIANCDQVIFIFAGAKPNPQPRMLDRLLVAAEKAQIPSIVIGVNKMDLPKAQKNDAFAPYKKLGYRVIDLSAKTGLGVEDLRNALHGKVSVFTGPSGVGKSSLLNAVKPGLSLETSQVSNSHQKGRHTTRFSQLVALDDEGTYVADTPGIRAIAPYDIEPDELDSYFREIRDHVANCRFTDCTHIHEPGCAVLEAVKAKKISESRYDSYLRLREELEEQYIYL